jgi:molybdenum cofactor cytidylyltransferase
MDYPSSEPVIHVCVLAAGTSTRFGATKLVQTLRGKPLLQHALIAANGVCPNRVNLVVGHDQQAVLDACGDLADQIIVNSDYRSGLGTSIAAGVRSCRASADAILIMLADQPLITAEHLETLIEQWSGAENEIVASRFDATYGPPILFPSGAFDALSRLTGDGGAKSLLTNGEFVVRSVGISAAGVDVDTPASLHELDQD